MADEAVQGLSAGVQLVTYGSLIAAGVLVVLGVIDILLKWRSEAATRGAIEKAAGQAGTIAEITDPNELGEFAGIDFKANWEALASLATAIKDLDRSSRLFVLALAFVAVAGATVGLESIGEGISQIGDGASTPST